MEAPPRPSSLAAITIRRSIVVGVRYLAIGLFLSVVLTALLLRQARAFEATFPLELPLFAILGSTGGLVLFGNDRAKGVFEYLLAYGVRPRRLFANALLASAVLASIVLATAVAVGIGGFVAGGGHLDVNLVTALVLYSVPMTVASALFAAMVSMIWTAVSSPRAGLGGPAGLAPTLGIGPTILVLVAAETAPRSDYYVITVGAAATILAVVLVLAAASGRLLSRERLLSPM